MNQALEWAGIASGPSGVVIGVFSRGIFDRRVRKATAKGIEADAGRTGAEETKLDAEAVRIIAETAVSLVAPLKAEIVALSGRVKALEDENAAATGKLRRAMTYIRDLLVWISMHVPDEYPPPQAPIGLEL